MSATHYRRENGDLVEIATMNPHHRMAALANLRKKQPHRHLEIEGLSAAVLEHDRKSS